MIGRMGTHALADCWGCRPEALLSADELADALVAAAETAGATMLEVRTHRFGPLSGDAAGGLTVFAVLAESHASVHTYPEFAFAAVDVFTCGTRCDPFAAINALTNFLAPDDISMRVVARGSPGRS